MKKNVIILCVNILLVIAVISGINFYWEKNYRNYNPIIDLPSYDNGQTKKEDYDTEEPPAELSIPRTLESYNQFCGEERMHFGEQYNKLPITVLGCSYAYGHGLKKEESFPFLLSEITQRPILNYSTCGSNIIENFDKIYNDINMKNHDTVYNSQYIIYIYMHDHISRYLSPNRYDLDILYYDLFELNKFEKYLSKVFLFRYLITKFRLKNILREYPDSEKSGIYLEKLMKISASRLKKLSPNSKFIIIVYDEKLNRNLFPRDIKFNSDVLNSSVWNNLEKDGITIVHTKDLMGFKFDKRYKLQHDIADWHPNARAWKEFTPKFAKQYIK